ncbi:MAG: STAS domain-containing protein [Pseudomonadota bacterium]
MNLSTESVTGGVVLHVHEERVDAHNSGELKEFFGRLAEGGNSNIIVALGEVRFIDSSGLGALLSGYKAAATHEGKFVLVNLQPQVQSMFELTRLHRVFEIYSSLNEALGIEP